MRLKSEPQLTPNEVVARCVDVARSLGFEPDRRFKGRLAREMKRGVEESKPNGWMRSKAAGMLTEELLHHRGHPSGAREVRGTHSVGLVYDPLGYARRLPPDWPHERPLLDEVAEAIMERL